MVNISGFQVSRIFGKPGSLTQDASPAEIEALPQKISAGGDQKRPPALASARSVSKSNFINSGKLKILEEQKRESLQRLITTSQRLKEGYDEQLERMIEIANRLENLGRSPELKTEFQQGLDGSIRAIRGSPEEGVQVNSPARVESAERTEKADKSERTEPTVKSKEDKSIRTFVSVGADANRPPPQKIASISLDVMV